MNAVWNAPETWSGMIRLAPSDLAWAPALLDAVGRAGDHDLTRCVEVGDPDLGIGEVAGHLDLVVVEAEHRGHRARAFAAEPASCIAAARSETRFDALLEAQGSRGGQCGVLAERVTGAEARVDAESFDGVEHHEARDEGGQLRIAGVAELIGVGVEQQRSDVATRHLAGLVDEFPALVFGPLVRPMPGRCDPCPGKVNASIGPRLDRFVVVIPALPVGNSRVVASASPGTAGGRLGAVTRSCGPDRTSTRTDVRRPYAGSHEHHSASASRRALRPASSAGGRGFRPERPVEVGPNIAPAWKRIVARSPRRADRARVGVHGTIFAAHRCSSDAGSAGFGGSRRRCQLR